MLRTAYLSAEIGFSPDVPTYSGGLGILAGDHLKAAADRGAPLVAVTLLYRRGYFRQHLDPTGKQSASYPVFVPEPLLTRLPDTVSIELCGRRVVASIWRYDIRGVRGGVVPVLFLDTDRPDNAPEDREITHQLYGGDESMRLRQEAVLGFAGVAAVRKLFEDVRRWHLNEGHCALGPLALLRGGMALDLVRASCHFTTHTPVPAGHDVFPYELAQHLLGGWLPDNIRELAGQERLSMTELALSLCGTVNAVSRLHGEVTRQMFPSRDIGSVTNGVHHLTWVAPQMASLFDQHLPRWREEPAVLGDAPGSLPTEAVWNAHLERKRELVTYVNSETGQGFSPDLLTIGFARRAATYKRAALLFTDPDRLARICAGRVQFVFAGKAHPRDAQGQRVIQDVFRASADLGERVRVGYVRNYAMWSGALLTSGVDVWLNTPRRPREASGTSGMKAVLNGVPNASIADGWWAEGAVDGENGWVIGDGTDADDHVDAASLYDILENRIVPAYYGQRDGWARLMRAAIATSARFTAARMFDEYAKKYYR